MALQGFLELEGEDFAAFIISALAGYAAGNYLSSPQWSVYVSILVSYHLFLGWLVLHQSGKAGLAMPWLHAIPTHAACMFVALGPAVVSNHQSLGFGLFRYGIASLAIFETGWLFAKEESSPLLHEMDGATHASEIRASAEDEAAWIEYLQRRRPGQTRAGMSVREERDAWLRARQKARETTPNQPVPPQPAQEARETQALAG